MFNKNTYKTLFIGILICMTIFAGITMALKKTLTNTYDACFYCKKVLIDTGLALETIHYLVEEKYCESTWIDAAVYFKLRVSTVDVQKIIEKILEYHEYKGSLSIPQYPSWWQPTSQGQHFVYYKDSRTATPVVIVDVDQNGGFSFVYIAIIPV